MKLGAFFVLSLAVVGTSSALTWEKPSSSEYYQSSVNLSVSNSSVNHSLDFWVKVPGGSYESIGTVSGSNGYWNDSYSKASNDNGDFSFKANYSSGNSTGSVEITGITMDTNDPSGNSYSPSDGSTISSSSTTVSFSADGTGSGVNRSKIWVFDSNDNVVGSSSSSSVDVSNLEHDATYDVTYFVEDNAGNTVNNTEAWSFSVDTKYEGGTPQLPSDDGDDKYRLAEPGEDEALEVDIDAQDESSVTVTCYDGDDNKIDSFTADGDETGICDVPIGDDDDEYMGETTVYAEVKDDVGNSGDSSQEKTYYFDTDAPVLAPPELEAPTYNSGFEVELDVTDESGVSKVEYYFDESVELGGGNVQDYSEDTPITVNLSGREAGDQTVYFRAKDKAGRWSSAVSAEFNYLPSADPRLSITAPSTMEVTAGDFKILRARIKNTGKLLVEDIQVEASGTGVSGLKNISELSPGDAENLSFEVAPSEEQLGEHTLKVSSKNPSASSEVALTVKANEDQQSSIESRLEEWKSRLSEVESNITSLKQKVSPSMAESLESNLSAFRSKVEDASRSVEQGEYYKADKALSGIDSEYEKAEQAYADVQKRHRKNQNQKMMIIGALLAGGLLIGVTGFFYRSEEYDLHLERIVDSDISVSGLEGLKSRLRTIFKNEAEAEEFEWNGFQ